MNQPHEPNVTADIRLAAADPDTNAGVASSSPRTALPPSVQDRYTLGHEIARGGMGIVYRATDTVLGREVAVKVLHEKYSSESGAALRFAGEARITGQLQHPSIPPVHDLGTLPDGQPFLAMKLIKGQTLAALLKQSPSPLPLSPGERGVSSPLSPGERGRGEGAAERGRFVAVFEQICQALAYAHAHDVIHRDLKPSNVMVGAFGEVQVMDWGVAKVLQKDEGRRMKDEPEPETCLYSSLIPHPSSFPKTQAGSMVGTPAYAPPEQVAGEIDKVDARADVFGLGAILAVLLTGKPPYVGDTDEAVRVQALRGKLDDCFARLDACGAEPELVALCKRCLAFEPANRPAEAGAVAKAVAQLRAAADERARRAELQRVRVEGEQATAQARAAEQRKRRRVQMALAAALVMLLLGGGAFAWWRNEQAQIVREREGRNAEAVTALLDQAEEALRAGDAAKAALALDAARKRSAEGGAEEQSQRLARLDADLALLRDLDAVDQFRWTPVENKWPDAAAVAARYREALARFGADPEAVASEDAAARVSDSVVREPIVMALDRLLMPKTGAVRALLRLVDANPYRDAVRDAVLADDRAKFVELAGQPEAQEQPPGFVAFLGESKAIKVERRRQLLEAAVSRRSGNLGLLMTLASTYPFEQADGVNEGLRWYQSAVAAAPANAAAHNALGVILGGGKGDYDGAIACFNKAIELDPKYAKAHSNLGLALAGKGQVDEAIACYKKAIELDPKFALAHNNLGNALGRQGQLDAAIACYKKAIELDPKDAAAHTSLGVALYDKGQVDKAIACHKKAIELDPKFAPAQNNLGLALEHKGRTDEAIACYKKAIELDPKLAAAHNNLGAVLCDVKHDYDGAVACFRKAIELDPKYAEAHMNLGNALSGKGQVDEAVACFKKAIALDPKLADAHYNLACCLTLAAAGKGEQAAQRDETERARLRRQALASLRTALALCAKQLEAAKPGDRNAVQRQMLHWQQDSDLAGIRDAADLAKLPADEQKACTQLWADVAELLKKCQQTPK